MIRPGPRESVLRHNLGVLFLHFPYGCGLPIGFEESTLDKDQDDYFFQTQVPPDDEKKAFTIKPQLRWDLTIKDHLISLDFKDARLEDVLNGIVKTDEELRLRSCWIRGFGVSKGEDVGMIQPMIVFICPSLGRF